LSATGIKHLLGRGHAHPNAEEESIALPHA
jgi:hypothetical protein